MMDHVDICAVLTMVIRAKVALTSTVTSPESERAVNAARKTLQELCEVWHLIPISAAACTYLCTDLGQRELDGWRTAEAW